MTTICPSCRGRVLAGSGIGTECVSPFREARVQPRRIDGNVLRGPWVQRRPPGIVSELVLHYALELGMWPIEFRRPAVPAEG